MSKLVRGTSSKPVAGENLRPSSCTPSRAKMNRMSAKRPRSWLTASSETSTHCMIFCSLLGVRDGAGVGAGVGVRARVRARPRVRVRVGVGVGVGLA